MEGTHERPVRIVGQEVSDDLGKILRWHCTKCGRQQFREGPGLETCCATWFEIARPPQIEAATQQDT